MAGLQIEENEVQDMMASFKLDDSVNLDFDEFKRLIMNPPPDSAA